MVIARSEHSHGHSPNIVRKENKEKPVGRQPGRKARSQCKGPIVCSCHSCGERQDDLGALHMPRTVGHQKGSLSNVLRMRQPQNVKELTTPLSPMATRQFRGDDKSR